MFRKKWLQLAGVGGALVAGSAVVLTTMGAGPKTIEITANADPVMAQEEYNTPHGAITGKAFNTDANGLKQEVLHLKLPQGHFVDFKSDGYITGPGGRIDLNFNPDTLQTLQTSNGVMDYGPIHGTATMPDGKQYPVILAVGYVAGTDKAQFTITFENMGAPVHMFFGTPFVTKDDFAKMGMH